MESIHQINDKFGCMKEDIEILLEDYKRRLNTANKFLEESVDMLDVSPGKYQRYGTKASCYRTIISELERIIIENNKK